MATRQLARLQGAGRGDPTLLERKHAPLKRIDARATFVNAGARERFTDGTHPGSRRSSLPSLLPPLYGQVVEWLLVAGFVVGFVVGRWWAVGAAVPVDVLAWRSSLPHFGEDEAGIPSLLGWWFGGATAVAIAVG